jgi:Uma2 family endonuclease
MAEVLLPRGELTIDDLAVMPDDGHRFELIDGALIVTPSPATNHQVCSMRLGYLLHGRLPPELTVLAAPYDYVISESTVLEPDLLVTRTEDLTSLNLQVTPLLVVEILSPSTRRLDLGTKRTVYADAGVPGYWIIDVAGRLPSLTVLTLGSGGGYDETAVVTGDEEWTDPVLGVTVVPARLVGPLPPAS